MSETVSLEFIGRRLDSVQNDMADVRRRMVALVERFDRVAGQIDELTAEVRSIGRRPRNLEDRIDAVVNRLTGIETSNARIIMLLEAQ